MSAIDEDKKAIRILSFDNGGPGTYSQLLIVKEYMARIAHDVEVDECEIYPADYFDLMGGVGFGGLASLLLGRLRMDVDQAIETLLKMATAIPSTSAEDQATLEANTGSLLKVVSEAMKDCGITLDVKMYDKSLSPPKCKVTIYAATTANLSHPVTFRTYTRRGLNTNLTIVDAICSTLASPSIFAPVTVRNGRRQQKYVGGVHGANNPTRELLKEAGSIFGEDTYIAQILSIGAGRPRVVHLDQATLAGINQVLEALALDCEGVAAELSTRLSSVEAYLRLNVDRGMESASMHDWDDLGSIETHTSSYMDGPTIQSSVEASLQRLHGRVGVVTLREINNPNNQFIRVSGDPPTDFATKIAEANDTIALLKALCEWLGGLHTKYTARVNNDWSSLLKMLKFHIATVENHITKLEEDVKVDLPAPSANDIAQPIEAYYSITMKLADVKGDMAIVTEIIPDMESKFEEYTTALHRSVEELASHTLLQSQPELPQEAGKVNINPNSNAYGNQHVPCLSGTRKKTLRAIRHWDNDNNTTNRMFCLLDVAGSGKSTVVKTMADEWKAENRLVARFFFSRDTAETMSTKSFCSTVANNFAACNGIFKASMEQYMKRPDWHLLPLEEQFEGLVAGPLRKCQQPAILMIDALDECGKEHGVRRTLLETLCSQFHSASLLRILVTGRPEPDIKNWAIERMGVGYTNFAQLEGGSKDVEFYIRSRLQKLPSIQGRLYPVIRDADGLFIWARIACDLLLNAVDAECLLETLGKEVSLDYLYKVALKESIPEDRASQARMITVLQMILAAKEPLSIVELDRLSPKRGIVEPVVTRLSSLLLHQNREDPIRLLHATLREFLTAQKKAGEYYIQSGLGHYTLALGCIGVVSHQAAQGLDNLTRLDRVSARIFHYSSTSWVHHSTKSCRKLGLNEQILKFANGGLQNWLGMNIAECVDYILPLCRERMSPGITEILVDQGLKKEYPDWRDYRIWEFDYDGDGEWTPVDDGEYFDEYEKLHKLKKKLKKIEATFTWREPRLPEETSLLDDDESDDESDDVSDDDVSTRSNEMSE